jgi:hypothetical protein
MSTRSLALALLALLAVGTVATGIAVAKNDGNNKTFQYAVGLWGDMPYSDTQAKTGVPSLIADMNGADIAFSVHDGDLKAGRGTPGSTTPTTCADPLYTQGLGYFESLRQPAIFTPGDNDWTDCDRNENGNFIDVERLQHERQVFFSSDQSLGQKTMALEVQSTPTSGDGSCLGWNYATSSAQPTACVENRRWTYKGVTYATLNVQGTCNNRCSSGAGDPAGDEAEYQARNKADLVWLDQTFDEANAQNSAGVMIIWQADPGFDTSGYQGAPKRDPKTLHEADANPDGFFDLLSELRARTIAFTKPVVLVHGDSHYFVVDKPLLDSSGRRVENFTRVETFGDHTGIDAAHPEWDTNDVHWVKALVDPNSRDVFAFQPQIVPANRVAVPSP